MKMKIAILGSTGSIGKSTLDVIRKDKKILKLFFYLQIIIIKNLFIRQKNLMLKMFLLKTKFIMKELKEV